MKKNLPLFISSILFLSACGGSNSSTTDKNADNNDSKNNVLPTVNAGSDKTLRINETISITGTATDSDGTIKKYNWKNGNNTIATTATFDYSPDTVGVIKLSLTVTDNDGGTAIDSMQVTVKPVAPIVNPSSIKIGAREVKATALEFGKVFISPNGSGIECAIESPCSFDDLFNKRLSVLKYGDTVFFREGTYSLKYLGKWNPLGNITYESYPGETAIIDGGQEWWTYIKFPHVTFRKMTFQNSRAYGVQIKSSYNLIEGCTIKDNLFSGIDISNNGKDSSNPDVNSFNIIKDNYIYNNSDEFRPGSYGDEADGIVIHYGTGNVVQNNTIHDNSDDGIDGFASHETTISYNLIYNNGKGSGGNGNGIKLASAAGAQGAGDNQSAIRNIAYNNKSNGIVSQTTGRAKIMYNTAYNNARYNNQAANYTANSYTKFIGNIADSDYPLIQYIGDGPDNGPVTGIAEQNICSNGFINVNKPLEDNFLLPFPNSNCETRGAYSKH